MFYGYARGLLNKKMNASTFKYYSRSFIYINYDVMGFRGTIFEGANG